MLDSDFWRDLAEKFRAIELSSSLRADWHYRHDVGADRPESKKWRVVGSSPAVADFEALARRGGRKLDPQIESLERWLEALLSHHRYSQTSGPGIEHGADGTVTAHVYMGTVGSLCQASVELCKRLESKALDAERLVRLKERERTSHPGGMPLEELRAIGLTVELAENTARRLWGALLEIDGEQHDRGISPLNVTKALHDAYNAIATVIVTSNTADEVIETMIPNMVDAFHLARKWPSFHQRELVDVALHGSITRWKGKKLQMEAREPGPKVEPPATTKPHADAGDTQQPESVGVQINRLRDECRLTIEELAEAVDIEARSVYRHLNGVSIPYKRHLSAYERVFSKLLKRQVTIRKMS